MASLRVEVVYALPRRAAAVAVALEPGASVRDAIEASGLLARFPEIDLARHEVGIHGEVSSLDAALADGDRVEIYRPLAADPKELRRRRALGRR
ncbi:MAG: RnfH family protein [Betaproteobacteria bacterium]|nr:RnfH family protein [Betaproteobacteria bacterium]